jgi:mTERF domain-containing protein
MYSSKFLPFPTKPTLQFSRASHTLLFTPVFLPQNPPSHKIPFKSHSLLHPRPLLAPPPSNHSTPASASPSPPNDNDQSSETQEAQEAVSEFLQELGVSVVDSDSISSNSPRYLAMLVDGVKDLDELSLWDSWKSEGKEFVPGDVGFKKKVVYMAKEKGDNGKVAFLESVGLSLSSAMNVARYLSAESLPCLIHKVRLERENSKMVIFLV